MKKKSFVKRVVKVVGLSGTSRRELEFETLQSYVARGGQIIRPSRRVVSLPRNSATPVSLFNKVRSAA